jgi:IS5 family transposase
VAELERIDAVLASASLEWQAIDFALENFAVSKGRNANAKETAKVAEFALFSLRAEVLRHLRQLPSFREYSKMLATSDLLADFCRIRLIDGIKWSSKSTLERASKFFGTEQWQGLCKTLTEVVGNADTCTVAGLAEAIDVSVVLGDSTCLEANVHYPVDWVLLKDVALALIGSIRLVRREGLLNRMENGPEELAREMNRLCIEMTHSARQKDGRKKRKAVFRKMKKHLQRVRRHAHRHCTLLRERWEQTTWSSRQAERIIERMEDRIALVPEVIKQAHERIIGGRKVAAKEKILSAHERDLHTLVRRKAGKEVEFGNALFLAESPCGFILDHRLYRKAPPGETHKMIESLKRQQALDLDQPITDFVGDRGFDSARATRELKAQDIDSQICPKNPDTLRKRMGEERFRSFQKRRAGTEARIAIFKNHGAGRVCRAKGFDNRERTVACGVLSHNLLWIARRSLQDMSELAEAA